MFREAATRYLEENMRLASIGDSALHLRQLDPFIGALTLDRVHSGTLQSFIEHRRHAGVKVKTINLALGLVRRILYLSARLWRDEHGLTWLENAPLIQLLPDSTAREPCPLDWKSSDGCFRRCRIIWPGCACSKSTPDVANRKCADCAGNGRCRCRSCTPRCSSFPARASRTAKIGWWL